ncbi:hypothetical protein CSPX01_11064 [Colletotrichum filicis]|nr:hypothetical protein CSPX01_11064 [Colletotrichum filicis]
MPSIHLLSSLDIDSAISTVFWTTKTPFVGALAVSSTVAGVSDNRRSGHKAKPVVGPHVRIRCSGHDKVNSAVLIYCAWWKEDVRGQSRRFLCGDIGMLLNDVLSSQMIEILVHIHIALMDAVLSVSIDMGSPVRRAQMVEAAFSGSEPVEKQE